MSLRAEELAAAIRRRIEQYAPQPEVEEAGIVLQVADGIVRVHGLAGAMAGEVVEFAGGERALVLNLEEEEVGAVILGPGTTVSEGAVVRRTGRGLDVPVGDALVGRVVNALGAPIDGRGPVEAARRRPVDWPAPAIAHRQPVKEPLQTGIKAVDAMIPMGRGQRELLIGDRETGKTAIAIDAIINQRGSGVMCIYVAIGQKTSSVARVARELDQRGAMDHTIVVSGAASEPPVLQYLAPYTGCAMAEEFMYGGRHALIVYDDLARHAIAYRAMSLLLRRPPGREAYPGDVFFQHARLLERAARLRDELGGGSLTAIPVVTTLGGDVAAYIPTNVISITDGQIYLETELFFAGFRPAINVGLSVSRVGGAAQVKAMKQVAGRLRLDLAQYRELEAFARFATELDEGTRRRLERGKRLGEVLKQPQYAPMPVEEQVAIMYAATHGYLDDLPVQDVGRFESEFLEFMRTDRSSLLGAIRSRGEMDEALLAELTQALGEFKSGWAR